MEESMEIEDFDFNTGKRIAIELGTELQIKIEGVNFSFKSTFIGIKSDKYLIINVPVTSTYGSIKHKYFQGTKIIVRYLYKGTVFGFQSELLEDIYNPLKLLFVKYPEIIENHNLRSHERIDCLLPIKIKIKDEEKDGAVLDISIRGCCCVFKGTANDKELLSVQIDEQIPLMCQFPSIEGEQLILGKVKSIKKDKQQIVFGIKFHEIDTKIEDIINQYILAIKGLSKLK